MISSSIIRTLFGAAILAGALALRPPAHAQAPDWKLVTRNTEFDPRDSSGEMVFKGHLWLLGGWFNSYETPPRDVWKSADGVHWDIVTSRAQWKHSDLAMTVVFKDRMWLMGGWYNGRLQNNGSSDEVWSSEDGKKWELVAEHAGWSPRLAGALVVLNGKLWMMGGADKYYFGEDSGYRNDVWNSEDGKTWKQVTAAAPWAPRGYHQGLAFDGKLWIMGGGKYLPEYKHYNDVWSSPDGVNWTQVTAKAGWEPRLWFPAIVYRDRMWVMGGWSRNPANPLPGYTDYRKDGTAGNMMANWNDVWHSADGKNWEQLKTKTVWKTRHEHSAYVFQGKLWVTAGHTWPLVNDVWVLDLPPTWPK